MQDSGEIDVGALSRLTAVSLRLFNMMAGVARSDLTVHSGDHQGFVLTAFGGKQLEHLKSLNLLVAAGADRDATIIARVMFETSLKLHWLVTADDDSSVDRCDLWRKFAFVQDWRRIQTLKRRGVPIDAEEEQTALTRLAAVGDAFLTAKQRNRKQLNQPLDDDPYHLDWPPFKVKRLAEMINILPAYAFYEMTSGWIHSTMRSIGHALLTSQPGYQARTDNVTSAELAYIVALPAVVRDMRLLDKHFGGGMGGALSNLDEELGRARRSLTM